ncbi:hypothetical protein [Streptomyces sp. SudanB182_2057]|uniref:hypothetical protein n=1 Tax=Streptomyces sp. SudanB182_2057 TaxID=3035281 RepID=UPI003F550F36
MVLLEGAPVFVEPLSQTDLELWPECAHFTHYGVGTIGSTGFGAWREPTVHTMSTHRLVTGRPSGPLTWG